MISQESILFALKSNIFVWNMIIVEKQKCLDIMICSLKYLIHSEEIKYLLRKCYCVPKSDLICAPETQWRSLEPHPLGHLPRSAGRGQGPTYWYIRTVLAGRASAYEVPVRGSRILLFSGRSPEYHKYEVTELTELNWLNWTDWTRIVVRWGF